MANNGGQIRFGVGFDVDQSGLSKIKTSLKELMNMKVSDLKLVDADKAEQELKKIKESAGELQSALQKSFNQDLGTLNITKFNQELKKLDLKTIQQNLSTAGAAGTKAFKDIATQALTTNMQLKQTNGFLEKMGTTMINTVKWGITSSIMKNFSGAVQEAFGYVKALDTSLTDIRIVTGQSTEEMKSFAVEANNAAAALGRQTKEYTNAALTFYQQGLNDKEVKARTEATLKAANITGESSEKMSEYLTSVWNGFQVSNENAEDAVSKLAAVADSSASNMAELATGMSKVASTANSMGVTIDQLSAQIATVIATTRQAPESVGNAFKTVYARIADIKAGTDDAEISLGNYSTKMAGLGINVLNSAGELRDLGDVFEEIGSKWEGFNREQQIYLAQVMGGQRQYNQLISLFDNWTKYSDMLNISLNSQGAIDEKNAVYMESLEAHTKQLKAAQEDLMDSLINSDSWKSFIDFGTQAINVLANFIDGIGGGGNALLAFGSILTRVFSKQISNEISNIAINIQNTLNNKSLQNAQTAVLTQFQDININSSEYQQILNMKQQELDLGKSLTLEEHNQINEIIKATNNIQNQKSAWEENKQQVEQYLSKLQQIAVENNDVGNPLFDFEGSLSEATADQLKDFDLALQNQQQVLKLTKNELSEYTKTLLDNGKALKSNDTNVWTEAEEKVINTLQNLKKSLIEFGLEDDKVTVKIQKIQEELSGKSFDPQLVKGKITNLVASLRGLTEETDANLSQARSVIQDKLNGIEHDLEAKSDTLSSAFSNIINIGQLRATINNVVSLAGAFGQVASSISAIKNLGNIWDNKDLSTGEKILQTLTNLGMVIPMLVSSFGNLNKVLGITNTLKTLFGGLSLKATGAITGEAAASGADAVAKAGEAAATEGATVAQYGLNAAMAANPVGLVIMAIAGLVAAIGGAVAIYDALTMSVEEANEALETFNEKQKEVQQNTADFSKNVSSLQEMSEEYDHLSAKAGKYDSNINQLTEDERNRYNEIKNVIAQYNEDAIVGYNQQGEAILANNEALKETIELLKEKHQLEIDETYNSDEFKENQRARQVILNDARNKFKAAEEIQNAGGNYDWNNLVADFNSARIITGITNDSKANNAIEKLQDLIASGEETFKANEKSIADLVKIIQNSDELRKTSQTLIGATENLFNNVFSDTGFAVEQAEQELEKVSKIDSQELLGVLQTSENNELYNKLRELGLDNIDAIISAYVERWKAADGAEYEDAFKEVLEKVKEKEEEWVAQLSDKKTVDDINKSVIDWSNSTFKNFQERTDDLANRINKLLQKGIDPLLIQRFFGLDELTLDDNGNFKSFKDNYIAQLNSVREEINKEYNQQMTMKGVQGIFDQTELESWDQIKEHIHMSTVESQGFVIAMREAKEEMASISHLESLNDILPTVSEGEQLDLDEDQQAAYDKLIQDYEFLNELRVKGGHEYLEVLRNIREQEEENAKLAEQRTLKDIELRKQQLETETTILKERIEKYQSLGLDTNGLEIELEAKTDELDATLAEYEDHEITLELAIDQDFKTDIDNAFDMADEIGYLQGQISSMSDSLEISFDQAQEYINNGWGAILEGAEETANQTILLNKDTVNAFVDGKQAEIEADRQAKIQELESQKTLLETQRNLAQQKVDTLKEGLEAQTAEEASAALAKAKMYDLEIANQQAALQEQLSQEEEANTEISEDKSRLAEVLGEIDNAIAINAGAAFASAENSSYAMAEASIQHAQAMGQAWDAAWKAAEGQGFNFQKIGLSKVDTSAVFSKITADASYETTEKTFENIAGKIYEAAEGNIDVIKESMQTELASSEELVESLTGNIGAVDAGIAALKGANASLDKAQAGLGGSGSGGGKGGGGGSKGGTSKETTPDKPDHMDPFEDSDLTGTKAMFRGIDAELEQIAARLEKIQRIQSHLLGSALVVNLNKQLKVLKEQRALYQQKLDLAKQEAAALQGQLTAMGATFGRGGALTNATDILKKQAGQVNDLIDKYNGMTKAEQDAFKENIETAKKGYNKTKELISAYEELNSLITQTKSQLDQIKEQIAQIKIERFNAVIDMRIRWQDWTSKLREFQKDLDEFQANHATITINTETGEITRNESAIENATRLAAAQRQNDIEASAARAIAQNDYRYDLNRLKTKSGRKQLSREYGIDLTRRKNRRQWRADRTAQYEQSIANIDANNANFRQQMSAAFSDTIYGAQNQAAYNQLLERQAQIREEAAAARQAAQDRKKSDIGAARTGTKSERQALGDEYDVKNIKKGSAGLINAIRESYFEAIDDINNTEVAGLQKAMDEFFEQVKLNGEEAANTLGMVTKDLFAEFDARMANVKAASEEIIEGRDIGDGKRARSFIDMETEHALDMSNRLGRMYQNSIFDENGNIRKVGSDKLAIGDIDPTTGRTITNNKQLKKAKGRIKEQGGYNEVYGKWLTEALDDAEKHAEQITNTITTLQEQITEAWNIYYEAIDRVIELQERIIENLEFINEMYEIQYKYAQLLRKPSEELYQAQRRQAEGLSTIANQYKENAINAKKQLDELGEKNRHNEEDWNKWFKVYQDSTKAYYETELQRLDALKEAAQEYIETMIKGYEKAASLGLGLSEFSQRWEDTKQITDMYLNNIDKAFAIQQLQAKYQEAINSETDPKRQAQIRDIMEQQISLLESAEYLSQAEVDNANALYDVTVKQIALEEAQRNKSKMRLRRDSQGNYTYQYVSDANDIKKKQEDLANSLQSMNKATSDALRETYDTQIKITQDYYSRLAELQKQYAEGELTDEEFTERGNYLEADYQQKLAINSTQEGRLAEAYEKGAAITLTGLTEIAGSTDKVAEWMGLNVQETANLNKAVLDLTGNGDNSLLQVMGNKNLAELFKQADTHNNNILTSDAAGWKLLRDDILPTKLFGSATGIDLSTLATEVKQNVTDESIETRAEIDKEAEEIYSEITGDSEISLSTVQDTIDTLNEAINTQLKTANETLSNLFNQAVDIETANTNAIGGLQTTLDSLRTTIDNISASLGSIASTNENTATVSNNQKGKPKIHTFDFTKNSTLSGATSYSYSKNSDSSKKTQAVIKAIENGTQVTIGKTIEHKGQRYTEITTGGYTTWVKSDRLTTDNYLMPEEFASGGYTGSWTNTSGRLAVLHQKEQVLNADDTQKVFDAVKIANNVASIVSTLGTAAANSILSSQFGTNLSFGQSALDQNVAISATFPNVTDHNEIEQALNNLINKASQYATPNRRQY